MRYNKSIFGYESEVDNPAYFLAKDGKKNPLAEMNASIKSFEKKPSLYKNINQHPVCIFPGRYTYLKRIGKIQRTFNLENCSDYTKFKNKLELSSVSIIFSSYFINKPASAFGHTLLKLNKEDPMTSDLKSYGVDFSAQVTTKNPLAYGILGIAGGFYGRFSLLPYFLKLREYNDFESRDLWEFELNLNEGDIELFVAHLWDMNLALFDYFYFTENCSYHVTRFVDAIKPEWKLMNALHKIVAPIDTLIPLIASEVKNKNITKGIYFRPSQQKRSQIQLDELDSLELEAVKNSIDNLKLADISNFTEKQKVKTLDAIIDFTDYKFPVQMHLASSNNIQDFKRDTLLARSKVSLSSKKTNKFKEDVFDFAHYSRRLSIGHRNTKSSGTVLEHRFALHNILEPQGDVYSKFSLEMGRTQLFYDEELKKLKFEEFELAHVEALRPFTYLEKKISWNFNFGMKNRFDIIAPFINVGIGASADFLDQNFSIFLQTENDHPFNEKRYQNSLAGINLQWVYKYKGFGVKANYKKYRDLINAEDNLEFITSEMAYQFSKKYQIKARTSKSKNDDRTTLLFSKFY